MFSRALPGVLSGLPGRIFSPFVLAVSVLLVPFAERSSAQTTVGGSNPITITASNDGVGVSASSTVTVTAAELPSAER